MPAFFDSISSHRHAFTTGQVTTVAAGGALLSLRFATGATTLGRSMRIRHFDAEFITTTAFGAAQEVGYAAYVARSFTVAPSGGTAITISGNEGKKLTASQASILAGAVATTGALTTGTRTLDANPFVMGSSWSSAIGSTLGPRTYAQSIVEPVGIILATSEGIEIQNLVLMGATGTGRWTFTVDYDIGVVTGS